MNKKYLNFNLELKEMDGEDPEFFYFSGYASTFGNIDRHDDVMVKGCFQKTLAELTPSLLWQHDMAQPVGIFEEVYETDQGLFVKGKMPRSDDLVKGRVIPQMKCGSIRTMSIGFTVKHSSVDYKDGVCFIREVDKLWEISLVTVPANPLAMVTDIAKNMTGEEKIQLIDSIGLELMTIEEAKKLDKRSFEKFLREAGVSKSAAVYLASRTDLGRGDPEGDESKEKAIGEALASINAIKLMLTNRK